MKNENQAAAQETESILLNMPDQIKKLRGKRLPPEAYLELLNQAMTCLSSALKERADLINSGRGVLSEDKE